MTLSRRPVRQARYSDNGRLLAVVQDVGGDSSSALFADAVVRVFDGASGKERPFQFRAGPIRSVAPSPDGRLIAIGRRDGGFSIIDAETSRVVLARDLGQSVNGIVWFTDGRVATAGGDGQIRVWNPERGQVLQSIGVGHPLYSISVGQSGQLVAFAGGDVVQFWRLTEQSPTTTIKSPGAHSIAVSGDDRYIASAGNDGDTFLWDLKEGRVAGHATLNAPVNDLSFGRGGDGLLVSTKREVLLLAIPTLRTALRLPGPAIGNTMAVASDGDKVIVGTQLGELSSMRIPTLEALRNAACEMLKGRALTAQEWRDFMGDLPYLSRCDAREPSR